MVTTITIKMDEMRTITIKMEEKCDECGKDDRTASGLCLNCATKALQNKPMRSATGRAVQRRFLDMKAKPRMRVT